MNLREVADGIIRGLNIDLAETKGKIDGIMIFCDVLEREIAKLTGVVSENKEGKEASEQSSDITEQPAQAPSETSI